MVINKTTQYTTDPNTIPVNTSTGNNQQIDSALDDRVVHVDSPTERDALTGLTTGQQVSVSGNGTSNALGGALFRWNGSAHERIGDTPQPVSEFGATYSGDDSQAVIDSLAAVNYAYIPAGRTCQFKNVQMSTGQRIIVDGVAKFPDGAVDFDRMIHAAGQSNLTIHINEIDGNSAGQSGDVGTHLIYLTDCPDSDVRVGYAHDHYYPRSFTTAPSPDGIRNDGSGALFFYQCHNSQIFVDRLQDWGHEGVYILQSDRVTSYLGMGQGSANGDEYSGIQMSGDYSTLLYANVDQAGATGIGFDVRYGNAGKLISTRSRFFNGVNLGHAGIPSDFSNVEEIIVDGCDDNGLNIVSSSFSPRIGSVFIANAGQYGINQSDGADGAQVSNGFVRASRSANIRFFDSTLRLSDSEIYSLYPLVLDLSSISGTFQVGETITGGTSGATATVQYFWNSTRKFVSLSGVSGTFQVGETITGGTSGATATVDALVTPATVSKGGTTTEHFSNVTLDTSDPMVLTFVSIASVSSVTVNNSNVRASFLPKMSPSNQAGAQAGLFISSVTDGSFTVETQDGTAAGAGAGFRYSLI